MAANPRRTCFKALILWERGKQFADEIMDDLLQRQPLEARDRGWLREAFFGTIRHLAQVDFLTARLREGMVDEETRAALRLGIYQLFFMRAAPHAVVNETVSLVGRTRA
jgi:16S rRNA (cytosine967-C5)-methyltransferase